MDTSPPRQTQKVPRKIHLIPSQSGDLAGLHPQLPAHPQRQPRRGAALLLDDAPEEVFPLVPAHLGRFRQGVGGPEPGQEFFPQSRRCHAADLRGV